MRWPYPSSKVGCLPPLKHAFYNKQRTPTLPTLESCIPAPPMTTVMLSFSNFVTNHRPAWVVYFNLSTKIDHPRHRNLPFVKKQTYGNDNTYLHIWECVRKRSFSPPTHGRRNKLTKPHGLMVKVLLWPSLISAYNFGRWIELRIFLSN